LAAVPPLVSDIDLSADDRWLYASCWSTGELKQYDAGDPFHPRRRARSAWAASCAPAPPRRGPRVGAWVAKLDADPSRGGLAADPRSFPHGDAFRGLRVHQTRPQGGDAPSDPSCHTR
jgi:selenium-binding protein 1